MPTVAAAGLEGRGDVTDACASYVSYPSGEESAPTEPAAELPSHLELWVACASIGAAPPDASAVIVAFGLPSSLCPWSANPRCNLSSCALERTLLPSSSAIAPAPPCPSRFPPAAEPDALDERTELAALYGPLWPHCDSKSFKGCVWLALATRLADPLDRLLSLSLMLAASVSPASSSIALDACACTCVAIASACWRATLARLREGSTSTASEPKSSTPMLYPGGGTASGSRVRGRVSCSRSQSSDTSGFPEVDVPARDAYAATLLPAALALSATPSRASTLSLPPSRTCRSLGL